MKQPVIGPEKRRAQLASVDYGCTATRQERIQLPLMLRHFYRGRPLSSLACQCLVNECLRNNYKQPRGWRAVHLGRVELHDGRLIA